VTELTLGGIRELKADVVGDSGVAETIDAPPILVATELRKRYGRRGLGRRKPTDAVAGVSLQVRPGETLAIVGESGAGKSTLGRLLNRLEDPDGGSVIFDGVDVRGLSTGRLRSWRKDVQMIFQ